MSDISRNSARVARNTLLLYARMLLMMVIGLFTSRVVLKSLGVTDFGVYNAVYEMVMLFSVISGSVSNAISRFMAYEIGREDVQRQKKVFSSAMMIQTMMSALLLILSFTLGLWYLKSMMVLPADRAEAAFWVLACSAGMMTVQLYSIPYNSTIIANEDMKAFAYISILEALLKLGVACLLWFASSDKLVVYSLLMLGVAVVTRSAYALYCHRHFAVTRGRWVIDWATIRSMLSFSGWSMLGNGVSVLNTRGVGLLANAWFGVGINAARGVAMQVENIVKQFITNFLTALNPQITKSWSAGSSEYSYHLVSKGCKYCYLMTLLFVIPFAFEADMILQLWLGDVPPYAAVFTRLTLVCLVMDMMANSLFQLILSTGRISRYYTVTSLLMSLVFAGSWVAFAMGAEAQSSYWIFIAVYVFVDAAKLFFAHREAGMPVRPFFREVMLPCAVVTLSSVLVCGLLWYFMPEGWLRLLLILILGTLAMISATFIFAMTPGERSFVLDKARKVFGGVSFDKN